VTGESAAQQVFVSYSRQDALLVTPVVRLLRATRDFVFLDADTITPGRKWRPEIDSALRSAHLVVVFWCRHSSESTEVQAEYRTAIAAEKDVLPVLLDSTPIADDLAQFQWIDFRELAGERHGEPAPVSRTVAPAKAAMRSSFRRWALPAALTAAAAVVLLAFVTLRLSAPSHGRPPIVAQMERPSPVQRPAPTAPGQVPGSAPPPSLPAPAPAPSSSEATGGRTGGVVWIALLLVGAAAIWAVLRYRRRAGDADHHAATDQARQMSSSLEDEIRRRLVTP
jgi:hypothetical protein